MSGIGWPLITQDWELASGRNRGPVSKEDLEQLIRRVDLLGEVIEVENFVGRDDPVLGSLRRTEKEGKKIHLVDC
jgi:hypothetical protein